MGIGIGISADIQGGIVSTTPNAPPPPEGP
jgi:hypothetical protein